MAKKPSFRPDFGLFDPNLGHQYFFLKHLSFSVIRYGQLSSCTKSEKANGPVLRKPSDEWSDGQTDRRTRTTSYDAAQLTSSVQKLKHDERRCRNKKKYMKNYYYKKKIVTLFN